MASLSQEEKNGSEIYNEYILEKIPVVLESSVLTQHSKAKCQF